MSNFDVVIIGGSAAGITAAITARKHYPRKSILLIRKEKQVSIPCGIPYVFGIVGSPEKNLIPADKILEGNKIENHIGKVVGVNNEKKEVELLGGESFKYDKLIVATGSEPILPPIPGADKDNIITVKKDVEYLKSVLSKLENTKDLCIVGCGFIGVEIAEECRRNNENISINIVEMNRHCLQLVYDNEFCEIAENALKEQKINLLLDESVSHFEGKQNVEEVALKSGKKIKADLVIMGIGAKSNIEIVQNKGVNIGECGGIKVNRYMQSSDADIFACGDCADKISFFDGKPTGLKLASIATTEARIAAANLFTIKRANEGVIGVYSTVLNNIAFASAGLTEQLAIEKSYDVVVGTAESINRHPGIMPGGSNMKVKLVFDSGNKRIIGGQVSGALSGGELINTISACISQRMTMDDIALFQIGTHPALTASPIAYQLVNAAENAIEKIVN
jgi:NADH oxidase (H2O2-forming)